MEQKITWKHFLIFGSSLALVLILSNCSKTITEPIKTVNYIYINNSGEDLIIEVYNSRNELFKSFPIQNESEVETHTTKFKVPAPFHFTGSGNTAGDSILVRFNNEFCISYLKETRDKIFDVTQYDNYSEELTSQSNFTVYFTFTEDDYNSEELCN